MGERDEGEASDASGGTSDLDVGTGAADEAQKPFRATQAQMDQARADAKQYFAIQGFDPLGVTDIQVAWGESDMFQCVYHLQLGCADALAKACRGGRKDVATPCGYLRLEAIG